MRATILGLADRPVADPVVESHLEHATYPAIEAMAYEALDGSAIYAGKAAASIEREVDQVYVNENGVHVEPNEVVDTETVACEWMADLTGDQPWVGVDTSDGEWLFDALGSAKGVGFYRAGVDVDGFGSYVNDYPTSSAWNVTQSRSFDEDGDAEEATIQYHDAAQLNDVRNSADTSMLGFRYRWNDQHVRGVIAASGYVAIFDGPTNPSEYAAFIGSEVLPFASLPEEYQGTFADVREDEGGEADV